LKAAPPPSLPRAVMLTVAAALTAYVGCAAWLVWRTAILEPYSDMYDWLARWYRLQADGDLGRYLWAPHNFHHLVWTLAVLDLDLRVLGARSYLFLAVGALCLAITAAMLARVSATAAGPGLRWVGAGGAVALSAMGCDILDVSADIETTYVHALVFAVGAILLAERAGRWERGSRGGALACAIAAGLGSAAGLAVWPALAFTAWRGRRWRWLIVVSATAMIYCGVYVLEQRAASGAGSTMPRPHLAEAASLSIHYLALPWVRGAPVAGWPLGLAVLAAALGAVAAKGRQGVAPTERAAVGLILFALATAAMAGLARTGVIAPDLVPMRYAVFLIPLHVGLWILALPYLRQAWQARPRWVARGVVVVAGLMIAHQAAMAIYAVRTADENLRVVADFRAGKRSPAMARTIYSNLDTASALATRLRQDGLYQTELRPDPPDVSGSDTSASSIGR